MGCDIHVYPEYRFKGDTENNEWSGFGGRINPGRNYLMFSIMAGVRGKTVLFSPRGLPEDIGWEAENDNYVYISDSKNENFVDAKKAAEWVKYGSHYKNGYEGKPTWVSHPDWHSHSWLTCSEFKQVLDKYFELEQKEWEELNKERCELIKKYKKELNLDKDTFLVKPYPHEIAPKYQALYAALEKLESLGYETRLVFWFDN